MCQWKQRLELRGCEPESAKGCKLLWTEYGLCPPNSRVEALNPDVMVLGAGLWEVDHWEARISDLIRRGRETTVKGSNIYLIGVLEGDWWKIQVRLFLVKERHKSSTRKSRADAMPGQLINPCLNIK